MPSRSARTKLALPSRLTRLRTFPERKIARVLFQCGWLNACTHLKLFRIAMRKLAVIRITRNIKIDIATRWVCKPPLYKIFGDLQNLVDIFCGTRHVINASHIQGFQASQIIGGHSLSQDLDAGPVFGGLNDQLVVHISDIHHPGHLIPLKSQVALDRIKNHRADHVPNVAVRIYCRATHIHAHMGGL